MAGGGGIGELLSAAGVVNSYKHAQLRRIVKLAQVHVNVVGGFSDRSGSFHPDMSCSCCSLLHFLFLLLLLLCTGLSHGVDWWTIYLVCSYLDFIGTVA